MYETCIFDLYGTLVNIHTDEKKRDLWEKMALFYGYQGAYYEPEGLQKDWERLVNEMQESCSHHRKNEQQEYPEINMETVFSILFERKGVCVDSKLIAYTGQFFRAMSTDYVQLYDGTKEMLKTLKEHGKQVYLLTNAQRIFTRPEICLLHIDSYFDGIFISSEHGYKKPDLRFYEELLRTYHISRKTAVMVGNDRICDVEGAKRAGLSTVYIHTELSTGGEIPKADHVLRQMDMKKVTDILLS